MKGSIFKMLENYREKNRISFSMPGHKNGKGGIFECAKWDVTELEDTDNLYNSRCAVQSARKKISEIYSSDMSFIMVNGSTGGIFIMLAAVCKRGDKILVSRNCHMSVINACVVLGLEPIFFNNKIYNDYAITGEADTGDFQKKLTDDIAAVLITSPNYFGVVSDIKSISEILKEKNIPLLVDEAHGAHFIAGDFFPRGALELGADMVVQSTHKTLNGLNQSAILHIKSKIVDLERVTELSAFFQTSSPSYFIASSAENSVLEAIETRKNWEFILKKCIDLKKYLRKTTKIKIPDIKDGFFALDETRLVFNFSEYDITGYELSTQLRIDWNIDIEMCDTENIVLIPTPSNNDTDFEILQNALDTICKNLKLKNKKRTISLLPEINDLSIPPSDAFYSETEWMAPEASVGKISAQTVTVYPPGIPVLVPGMTITKECAEYLCNCEGTVTGVKCGKFKAVKER